MSLPDSFFSIDPAALTPSDPDHMHYTHVLRINSHAFRVQYRLYAHLKVSTDQAQASASKAILHALTMEAERVMAVSPRWSFSGTPEQQMLKLTATPTGAYGFLMRSLNHGGLRSVHILEPERSE
jgi:hypothetical protein